MGDEYDEYDEFAGLDEAIAANGPTEEVDTSNIELPQADNSDVSVDAPAGDVMPIGERIQVESGAWVTRNADGSTTYEDPDGSPAYTVKPDGTYSGGSGDSTWTYNPTTGESSGTGAYAGGSSNPAWTNVVSGVKRMFSDKNDNLDVTKILPMLAGAIGASKSGNNTQPAGYQGKIPKYTATRQAPGIGQALSGNVLFKNAAGEVVNPNSAAPASGLAAAPILERPMAKGGALQSGGFVVPADVVSHLGNGSSEAGLKLLSQRYGATPIKGSGDGMSDSIKTTIDGRQPARVANEEARLTKAQVQAAGGAQKLYDMMDKIRKARTGTTKQGKQINPSKFMPGGSVPSYVTGGTTSLPAGTTGTESSLSNWAGDYVTNMLGKGQALSEMPYEQYGGPLTAGPSALQTKAFTGLEGTAFPTNLGQTFSSSTAPTIGAGGQPAGGGGIAASYMNPYLSAVLNPQLEEQRRQAQINNLAGLGSFTKSGAFGGGRQAIMESENARNLGQEQNKTIANAYSNAYDKGLQQFNTEQQQAKTLVDLLAQQGATQRGIESEATTANKAQFEEARLNPYKMVQFQQSLLSGLPLSAQTYNQAPTDNLTQFAKSFGTVQELLAALKQS